MASALVSLASRPILTRAILTGGLMPDTPSLPYQWFFVERRFRRFVAGLDATPLQLEDYKTKIRDLMTCLNQHYWPVIRLGDITHILGGSWANGTQARPGSDIDLIYLLPWELQQRFQNRGGNIQSQILQDVRNVLLPSYPRTDIKGDGPTVVINFDSIKIEIAPVFRYVSTPIADASFQALVCHTRDGGSYKSTAPIAESQQVQRFDAATNGNLTALVRMAKTWKRVCNVPIKSIGLQHIAMSFLAQWPHALENPFWHDWMMRDFFAYMLTRQNGWAVLPVSNEVIPFGNEWVSRTETALRASIRACEFEQMNRNALAGEEWQKIFGIFIPKEA